MEILDKKSEAILEQRGKFWGSFSDFVTESTKLKDSFRIDFKELQDMNNLRLFRLRDFLKEMLTLKLVRAIHIVRQKKEVDLLDEYYCDCACDFVNYCKLAQSEFAFILCYKKLKHDSDFHVFFEKVINLVVFGDDDEQNSE